MRVTSNQYVVGSTVENMIPIFAAKALLIVVTLPASILLQLSEKSWRQHD